MNQNVRHGTGKYTYAAPPPGEDEEPKPPLGEYNGAWKEGRKEGIGIMVYANKAKYHGNWKDGKQDGTGTLYYPNGDIYTGSWHAGKKHGPGTYFFKETATKVTGVWDYNQLATGTFVDKFGNSYTGAFSGSADSVGYVAGGEFSQLGNYLFWTFTCFVGQPFLVLLYFHSRADCGQVAT